MSVWLQLNPWNEYEEPLMGTWVRKCELRIMTYLVSEGDDVDVKGTSTPTQFAFPTSDLFKLRSSFKKFIDRTTPLSYDYGVEKVWLIFNADRRGLIDP